MFLLVLGVVKEERSIGRCGGCGFEVEVRYIWVVFLSFIKEVFVYS